MLRRWGIRLGVWLGVTAVAVAAVLPYHIATDIVHAIAHFRAEAAHHDVADLGAAADLGDHHPGSGHPHHHHHDGCAICVSLSMAVAAATLPAPVTIVPARREALARLSLASTATPSRTHLRTPYAPRAPPATA